MIFWRDYIKEWLEDNEFLVGYILGSIVGMAILWILFLLFKKCPVCPGYNLTFT